jgi:hypothetical protein
VRHKPQYLAAIKEQDRLAGRRPEGRGRHADGTALAIDARPNAGQAKGVLRPLAELV